jgi:hypothetical protein
MPGHRANSRQGEIFAALCRNSNYSDAGDWFVDIGYWHGYLNPAFWSAYQGAAAHSPTNPDAAGNVAHYMAMTDDTLKFIIAQ